jgi:hypothetical protein
VTTLTPARSNVIAFFQEIAEVRRIMVGLLGRTSFVV